MLLTDEDKKAIAESIKRAEQATSGEIVFAIADASGHYRHAILQGALLGTTLVTAVYLLLPVAHTIALVLWTEIVAFAILYALLHKLPGRRWFIPRRELYESVHEAAFREFYAGGLYRTRESNGILIYLSLLERKVVVLGDRGIHEKLGNEHWDNVRDRIIDGIKRGRARDGICAAVEACGSGLAAHFPHRPDDTNELPDEVVDRTRRDR